MSRVPPVQYAALLHIDPASITSANWQDLSPAQGSILFIADHFSSNTVVWNC